MPVDPRELVAHVAELAIAANLSIAVAESLTGGCLAATLAAGPDASTWFAGGVVAYTADVKQRVLGVPPGPVVSEAAARSMAEGVTDLLGADVAVAVTGVGGPGPSEGQPAGTVWWAVRSSGRTEVGREQLDGEPEEVVAATLCLAIERILGALGPSATKR